MNGKIDKRFSDPEAEPTPWAEALDALEQAELYWLTTVRADGRPHVTPLIGVVADEVALLLHRPRRAEGPQPRAQRPRRADDRQQRVGERARRRRRGNGGARSPTTRPSSASPMRGRRSTAASGTGRSPTGCSATRTVAGRRCSGSSQRRSSRSRRTRTARRRIRSDRSRLIGVHPHLPAPGSSIALVVEVVGATSAELGMSHVADAAEHRRNPAPRPSERVLDLGERARLVRRLGQLAEQRAHQVAGAVVEASDLAGVGQDVLRVRARVPCSIIDRQNATHERWAGLSGMAGALMFAVGNAIWGLDMPEDGTSVPEVVDFYADTADRIVIGGSLSLLSIAVFLVFGAAHAAGAEGRGRRGLPRHDGVRRPGPVHGRRDRRQRASTWPLLCAPRTTS